MPEKARSHRGRQPRPDNNRPCAADRGYDHRWRNVRLAFLRESPLCRACSDRGVVTAATDVDHIIPHRGNQELFWRHSNLQALCARCHSAKTGRGE